MKQLETKRLILRKLVAEDAAMIFENWASDPEVTEHLSWQAHKTVETTEKILAHWLQEYEKKSTYRWGMELKDSGELIGMIDVVRYVDGYPEVGYVSGKKFWGHGYMTEAFEAVIKELLEDGFKNVTIRAEDSNLASNRVIEKCGFHFVATSEETVGGKAVTLNNYKLYP